MILIYSWTWSVRVLIACGIGSSRVLAGHQLPTVFPGISSAAQQLRCPGTCWRYSITHSTFYHENFKFIYKFSFFFSILKKKKTYFMIDERKSDALCIYLFYIYVCMCVCIWKIKQVIIHMVNENWGPWPICAHVFTSNIVWLTQDMKWR